MNLVIEEWKEVRGYGGKYLVSSWGRVKSMFAEYKKGQTPKAPRLLKFSISKTGYYTVRLSLMNKITDRCRSKTHRIHRLVCEAFHPNPDNKPQINHKDLNKLNNHFDNLEWVTPKENTNHAQANGRMPIKKERVKKGYKTKPIIDTGTGVVYRSAKELAIILGTRSKYIKRKLNGHRRNNTPYRYLENSQAV